VDSKQPEPKYKIGNFVRCWYDFYNYYHGYYETPHVNSMHGIIVEIEYATWPDNEYGEPEIIYVVYCTDGVYRFFIEDEVYEIP